MGIVRFVSIYPQSDKTAEVRSELEKRISSEEGASLFQNILGELPIFLTTRVFDSLEDYDKTRQAQLSDAAVMEHRRVLVTMIRRPITVRLLRTIVDPVDPLNLPYSQQAIFLPQNHAVAAVRTALEEFTNDQQANGRTRARMGQVLYPHDGAALTVGDSYETMAEADNVARERAEKAQALMERLGDNLRSPVVHRLRQRII